MWWKRLLGILSCGSLIININSDVVTKACDIICNNKWILVILVIALFLLLVYVFYKIYVSILKAKDRLYSRQKRWLQERYRYANIDYYTGNYYGSEDKYKKITKKFLFLPKRQKMKLYYNIGYSLLKQRKHKKALAYFYKVIKIDVNHLPSLNCIGACYETLNRDDKAKKFYSKACRDNLNYPNPWNGLGVLYFKQGNLGDAINCYKNAVQCKEKMKGHYSGIVKSKIDNVFVTNLVEAYIAARDFDNANLYLSASKYDELKGFRGDFFRLIVRILTKGSDVSNSEITNIVDQSIMPENIGYSPQRLKEYLLDNMDCFSDIANRKAIDLINRIIDKRESLNIKYN